NGDGYDDLIVWGDEGGLGQHPTLFVFFGGELLENPDVRVDLTVYPDRQYQTADVAKASLFVSADRSVRGIAAFVQRDHDYFAVFAPFVGREPAPLQHSGPGWAPILNVTPGTSSMQLYAVERDTASAFPTRELLVGGSDQAYTFVAPVD